MMRTLYTVLFAVSAFLCLAIQAHAHSNVLRFAKLRNAPFAHRGEIALREAYATLGYQVEFSSLPPARGLLESTDGNMDGELLRAEDLSSSHPNLIRIDVPLTSQDILVFSAHNDFPLRGWHSLAGARVAFIHGFLFVEKRLPRDCEKTLMQTPEQLLELLKLDRVDFVILPRTLAERHFSPGNIARYIHTKPIDTLTAYHYLNRKHSALVPDITAALKDMQESGRLSRIFESQ